MPIRRVVARTGGSRLTLIHANFRALAEELAQRSIGPVTAFSTTGVSSMQLDDGRADSVPYRRAADMRLDPTQGETVAEYIVSHDEVELADAISDSATSATRAHRRRAQNEVARTTGELAAIVPEPCTCAAIANGSIPPPKRSGVAHSVNDELARYVRARSAIRVVRPGGRIAVISFHSLEDRIVKLLFREDDACSE